MSAAETLRAAERLVFERADAATPGRWVPERFAWFASAEWPRTSSAGTLRLWLGRRSRVATVVTPAAEVTEADAQHAAALDPDVARSIGALLRREADRVETDDAYVRETYPELAWEALRYQPDPLLLDLARAYLRETEES